MAGLPIALDSIADFSTTRVMLIKGKTESSVPLFVLANAIIDLSTGESGLLLSGDEQTGVLRLALEGDETGDLLIS